MVATERSYVKKLRVLKRDYADLLRKYARSKETAIIPAYEANVIFGNLDNLIPVNEAFLEDLEKMILPDGPQTVGSIGDVALKHFKELRGFEQYKQYYTKREEAQAILERETAKKSRFYTFIDVCCLALHSIQSLILCSENQILFDRDNKSRWPESTHHGPRTTNPSLYPPLPGDDQTYGVKRSPEGDASRGRRDCE